MYIIQVFLHRRWNRYFFYVVSICTQIVGCCDAIFMASSAKMKVSRVMGSMGSIHGWLKGFQKLDGEMLILKIKVRESVLNSPNVRIQKNYFKGNVLKFN